jgi:hypothetical protein
MAFKINKQKRVRILIGRLHELKRENYADHNFYTFLWNFEGESGLKNTSKRLTNFKRSVTYYFKIVDVKRYMLAKIKYGI